MYCHLYTAPIFVLNSRDGTQLGTVQFLHKGTKDVIKIDAIMPTLPHIPDFQYQC
jgi:hypothetical protein